MCQASVLDILFFLVVVVQAYNIASLWETEAGDDKFESILGLSVT